MRILIYLFQLQEYTLPCTDRNELSTITAPVGLVWEYEYNGLGQPVSVLAPNGIRTVYTYDARGCLAEMFPASRDFDASFLLVSWRIPPPRAPRCSGAEPQPKRLNHETDETHEKKRIRSRIRHRYVPMNTD